MRKTTTPKRQRTRAGITIEEPEAISTIADDVLQELRDLREPLSFLREHDEPDTYLHTLAHIDVLRDLSEDQQLELSTLVGTSDAQGDSVKWLNPYRRQRREWARRGNQRLKSLKKRMERACKAIEAVRHGVDDIEVTSSKAVDAVLKRALAVLDPTHLNDAEIAASLLQEPERAERAMCVLYDFFIGCGLANNEAEFRVGRIGNFCWSWKVKANPRYEQRRGALELLKGCDAVRHALTRRGSTTDI